MRLTKFDDELQIVYGEVYAPGVIDSQGDIMTADGIREMAHRFLINQRGGNIDVQHSRKPEDAVVVESFLARDDDPDYLPYSWVVGVHVADARIWADIKSGKLNGFSMDAEGKAIDSEVEIEVPEEVIGKTETSEGHTHTFNVHFDSKGRFMGGATNEVQGHSHKISKGTATDEFDGHSHRFSYIEGM